MLRRAPGIREVAPVRELQGTADETRRHPFFVSRICPEGTAAEQAQDSYREKDPPATFTRRLDDEVFHQVGFNTRWLDLWRVHNYSSCCFPTYGDSVVGYA